MQLCQDILHLLRDRQSQVGCIFQKAHTFIGDVEENHSRAEYAAIANDMGVQDMPDTDQCKNCLLYTSDAADE